MKSLSIPHPELAFKVGEFCRILRLVAGVRWINLCENELSPPVTEQDFLSFYYWMYWQKNKQRQTQRVNNNPMKITNFFSSVDQER